MRFIWVFTLSLIVFINSYSVHAQETASTLPPIEKKLQQSKNIIQESRTHRQSLKEMTDEGRKEYMELQRTRWKGLSEGQKEKYRTQMVDRWSKLPPEVRARRKKRFKNISPDRQEAFKERNPSIYDELIAGE